MGSWSQSSLERLVRGVIRRRKGLVLITSLIAVVVLLPIAYIASKEPQRYRSSAVVLLEAQGRVPVFQDISPTRSFPVLLAILSSRSLAESVVDSLPKASVQELLETSYQTDPWQSLWGLYLGWRGVEVPVPAPSRRALAELQRARVSFQPWPEKSGIITISAEASRPNVAVDIANTYIEALMSRTRTFNIDDARVSREFLEQQLTDVKRTLNASEQALQSFVSSHGGVRLPEQSRATADRLGAIEARLAEAVSNRKMVETRREGLREKVDGQKRPGIAAPASRTCSPDIDRLRNQLSQLESSLLDLRMRFTEEHPRVQLVKNRIDELTNLLAGALKDCVVSIPSPSAVPPAERLNFSDQVIALESTYHSMLAQEDALQKQAESLRQSLKGLSSGEAEYARLAREVDSQRNLHSMLSDKLTASRIREQGEMKIVKIIDPASSPVPVGNNKRMLALAVAFAAALGIGATVPAGVEWLHRRIENEDDVEAATGLPVLAMVPRIRGARPVFMSGVPESGRGPSDQLMFTEAFRALRVAIELSTRGEPMKRILVTSAFAEEGKSTIVANLGLALTEAGRQVVLADTDFLRPTLHKTMKIKSSKGLVETLESEHPLEPTLVPVSQGLWLAQRGESFLPRSRGMLAGSRLRDLITGMSNKADFVICDSSPVLLIPDNLLLASSMDGVILVARAGSTGFRDLARTKTVLEGAGARVLGVVLNQVPVGPLRKYYRQYYDSYVKTERK